jgi:two-component system, NarL family, response regulator DevR
MKLPPTRIVIIDDHEMVRKGLQALLRLEPDLVVVGEAGTLTHAVALVERLHPQMVLLDVKLPDASVMEACRRLLAVSPQLRILVLTSYAEDATVVAAVQGGAHGYVLKDVRMDDLVRAIRIVAAGRGYLDPLITQQTLHWIRTRSCSEAHPKGMAQLSPQERLIMSLLAEGKTNKEIAAQLRLSDKTVKNYLANIFDKLRVKRRTEAVAWFMKETRATYAGPTLE